MKYACFWVCWQKLWCAFKFQVKGWQTILTRSHFSSTSHFLMCIAHSSQISVFVTVPCEVNILTCFKYSPPRWTDDGVWCLHRVSPKNSLNEWNLFLRHKRSKTTVTMWSWYHYLIQASRGWRSEICPWCPACCRVKRLRLAFQALTEMKTILSESDWSTCSQINALTSLQEWR